MKTQIAVPTPHITASLEDIAKFVIMPGDPLRAKFIAENFLESPKQINTTRNMFMYTGTYKGHKITVAGSGMGMPSIGIYSYELFQFYGVDCILRVGSAGSYKEDLNVYDLVNVTKSYSESTFALIAAGIKEDTIESSPEINAMIDESFKTLEILKIPVKGKLQSGLIHSSDVFYRKDGTLWKTDPKISQCLCVEMESFGLFANAKILNKKAGCLLTISDSLVTGDAISAELREQSFKTMMTLALETAVRYYQKG